MRTLKEYRWRGGSSGTYDVIDFFIKRTLVLAVLLTLFHIFCLRTVIAYMYITSSFSLAVELYKLFTN